MLFFHSLCEDVKVIRKPTYKETHETKTIFSSMTKEKCANILLLRQGENVYGVQLGYLLLIRLMV